MDAAYNIHLCQESNRETDKANSFTDDNSTGTLANAESLGALQNIVSDFAVFSGLNSNSDKTTLLKIGVNIPLSREVLDLGFNVVENTTLLGMSVDCNLTALT